MRSDYCLKCGRDSFDSDLDFDNDLDFDDVQFGSDENTCDRCGENLSCSSWDGTGKDPFSLSTSFLSNRCDQCGRRLKTQTQKCFMCNGTGKVYHFCSEPFQI